MTDRYMHSDQSDIHDALEKLGKFQPYSGHTDYWVTDGTGVTNSRKFCKYKRNMVGEAGFEPTMMASRIRVNHRLIFERNLLRMSVHR